MKNILFYFLVLINVIVLVLIYYDRKEEINYIQVEIKGAVKNPGVYKLKENSIVDDQTTPIMIQSINARFVRNPLITVGI